MQKKFIIGIIVIIIIIIVGGLGIYFYSDYQQKLSFCKERCWYVDALGHWEYSYIMPIIMGSKSKTFETQEQCINSCLKLGEEERNRLMKSPLL